MTDRKDIGEKTRDENPGAGEQTGEAVGGIGGALAGAGLGSAAGPIGTILGGIAGAVGGWWAGEKAGRAVEDWGEHEEHYRTHYDEHGRERLTYEEARIGYGVGHIAGRNPDYRNRSFDEVEADLRSNWTHDRYEYETMRPYVRTAYARASKAGRPDRAKV